jgi:sulfur relay (sulfurtransferase) DsrC/TusE family protein
MWQNPYAKHYLTNARDRLRRYDARNVRTFLPEVHINMEGADPVPSGPIAIIGQNLESQQCPGATPNVSHVEGQNLRGNLGNVPPHTNRHSTPFTHSDMMTLDRSGYTQNLTPTDRLVVIELIKQLEVCTGEDELRLVSFLKQVLSIFKVSQTGEKEIIKLILPKTKSHLFNTWLQGINFGLTWDTLHSTILSTFFPGFEHERMVNRCVKRMQLPDENIVYFIDDIVSSSEALQCHFSDGQLIDITFAHMSPKMKMHFQFNVKPATLFELKNFATSINASIQADLHYFTTFPPQGYTGSHNGSHNRPHYGHHSGAHNETYGLQRNGSHRGQQNGLHNGQQNSSHNGQRNGSHNGQRNGSYNGGRSNFQQGGKRCFKCGVLGHLAFACNQGNA